MQQRTSSGLDVRADGLLDAAAAAAWTALRWHRDEAECVCTPEHDEKGLTANVGGLMSAA